MQQLTPFGARVRSRYLGDSSQHDSLGRALDDRRRFDVYEMTFSDDGRPLETSRDDFVFSFQYGDDGLPTEMQAVSSAGSARTIRWQFSGAGCSDLAPRFTRQHYADPFDFFRASRWEWRISP